MTDESWHLPDEQLRRYGERTLAPPVLWSVEAHLVACVPCRDRLAADQPELVRAGWERLDAELDAPVPGAVERLLIRAGVAGHTARLLAATPVLRLSWLAAVVSTLALTALLAAVSPPVVFLAVAPLLPVCGVALSFGPRVDPTYEIAVVAPTHMFRLLLLRCAAVLSVTTALSAVASLAVPHVGLAALGWFLPALTLTLLSLTLTARLGPVLAAASVGAGWLAVLVATHAAVFVPAGQLASAIAAVLAAIVLVRVRQAFDTPRRSW
ncbi:hypothetical protein ACTOB_002629 [Actinoplanes oblitus]|uniref:Zinc-finger domain-containing protein n=1 Tax=Actinoplanes oblitus TaxID=3040509 RepID=A0ABY8WPR0_9ACTN|nr:hypothetical protein [Actinoplanes oblitus]WIM99001.1 hypothetical protein ACTOB_002629 [Actinoplanes oblitus]